MKAAATTTTNITKALPDQEHHVRLTARKYGWHVSTPAAELLRKAFRFKQIQNQSKVKDEWSCTHLQLRLQQAWELTGLHLKPWTSGLGALLAQPRAPSIGTELMFCLLAAKLDTKLVWIIVDKSPGLTCCFYCCEYFSPAFTEFSHQGSCIGINMGLVWSKWGPCALRFGMQQTRCTSTTVAHHRCVCWYPTTFSCVFLSGMCIRGRVCG